MELEVVDMKCDKCKQVDIKIAAWMLADLREYDEPVLCDDCQEDED